MLAKTQAGGMCFAFPDVCLTPTPAGPVPIPYPNMGLEPTDVVFVPNVLMTCAPAHNLATMPVMTNGDIRPVYYAVEHGAGFAGIGRYVDFCVLGLDPWHVHDGSCRTVR